MKRRDAIHMLKEAGFTYSRHVRHGEMWTDGKEQVLLARSHGDPRASRNFKALIKRIVAARPPTTSLAPLIQAWQENIKEQAKSEVVKDMGPKVSIEENREEVKARRKRVPKEIRRAAGESLYKRMLAGEFPILEDEDVFNLIVFAEYAAPTTTYLMACKSKKISKEKDPDTGHLLFDGKDVFNYLVVPNNIALPLREATQTPVVPAPAVATEPPPVELMDGWSVRPRDLPGNVLNFYHKLAVKRGVPVDQILVSALVRYAEAEIKRIDELLEERTAMLRDELLGSVDLK